MEEEAEPFCSICQDGTVVDGGFGRTRCWHYFHLACWRRLLAHARRPLSCPCCRHAVADALVAYNIPIGRRPSNNSLASDSSDVDSQSSTLSERSSYTYNDVSDHDSSTATVAELPALIHGWGISEPVDNMGHLIEMLGLESRDFGMELLTAGEVMVNQCLCLAVSASMVHGMRGFLPDQYASTFHEYADRIRTAICAAVPERLREDYGLDPPGAVDSLSLNHITSAQSNFDEYAFIIVATGAAKTVQAWVGARYHALEEYDMKIKTIVLELYVERVGAIGHYTPLIPVSRSRADRPVLRQITDCARALRIGVQINNEII